MELRELPGADVLVHTGDLSNWGSEDEVLTALEWLMGLPYRYKVFLAGNHDFCLFDAENIEGLPENVYFLHNSGVVIEGVSFWGITYTNPKAPTDRVVDVLVSHEPPKGILDYENDMHWGSHQVLNMVTELRPKYHLFGHVHDNNGIVTIGETMFSNGSNMDRNNKIGNRPRVIIYIC
jgi:predicted phosphohydrolase